MRLDCRNEAEWVVSRRQGNQGGWERWLEGGGRGGGMVGRGEGKEERVGARSQTRCELAPPIWAHPNELAGDTLVQAGNRWVEVGGGGGWWEEARNSTVTIDR